MNKNASYRPINMKATGERIKKFRKERGITIEQLSERFLISPQAVCKWQQGKNLPEISNLIFLCTILEVKVEDLIVLEGDQVLPFSA